MAITDVESLPKLKFNSEYLEPMRDGYQLESPFGASVSQLPGGMPRVRRDTVNNAQNVTVSYELRDSTYVDWFNVWWRFATKEGSVPFRCLLSIGESEPQIYVAVALSAPKYTAMRGYNAVVTLELSAQFDMSKVNDIDIILIISEVADPLAWTNMIEHLALVVFTDTLGKMV